MKKESSKGYVAPYDIAVQYGYTGDRDHAFEWLEKDFTNHSGRMEYIKVEDAFDSMHSDPRFDDLLHRIGMPQ